MAPYKINKECYLLRTCLVGAMRMLLLMVEQVFLPMREVCSMHNVGTQHTVRGERRPKGRENFSCLNFSCLAIKYEFHFTLATSTPNTSQEGELLQPKSDNLFFKPTLSHHVTRHFLLFLFIYLFYFLATPHGLWDLSSATRD